MTHYIASIPSWEAVQESLSAVSDALRNPFVLHALLVTIPAIIASLGLMVAIFTFVSRGSSKRLLCELGLLYLLGVIFSFLAATSGQASQDVIFENTKVSLSEKTAELLELQRTLESWQWIPMVLSLSTILPLCLIDKNKKLKSILLILLIIFPLLSFCHTTLSTLTGLSIKHGELHLAYQKVAQNDAANLSLFQALGLSPLKVAKPEDSAEKLKQFGKGLEKLKKEKEQSAQSKEVDKASDKPKKKMEFIRPKASPHAPDGGGAGLFD